MERYEFIEVIGEGTYGIVIKCRHRRTGQIVAVKRFKAKESNEYARCVMLRELRVEQLLTGEPQIVSLLDAFVDNGQLYLVMEYIPSSLLDVLDEQPHGLDLKTLRVLIYTLLLAVRSCHQNGIIHRDIKPENILVKEDSTALLCDFGFSRPITVGMSSHRISPQLGRAGSANSGSGSDPNGGSTRHHSPAGSAGPSSRQPTPAHLLEGLVLNKHKGVMTDYVATRWYRSPEMLLGMSQYNFSVDMWAVGAIMAEAANGEPLLPGKTELEQLSLVQRRIGDFPKSYESLIRKRNGGVLQLVRRGCASTKERNPLVSPSSSPAVPVTREACASPFVSSFIKETFLELLGEDGVHLMIRMLDTDQRNRMTVEEALAHPFFDGISHSGGDVATPLDAPFGTPVNALVPVLEGVMNVEKDDYARNGVSGTLAPEVSGSITTVSVSSNSRHSVNDEQRSAQRTLFDEAEMPPTSSSSRRSYGTDDSRCEYQDRQSGTPFLSEPAQAGLSPSPQESALLYMKPSRSGRGGPGVRSVDASYAAGLQKEEEREDPRATGRPPLVSQSQPPATAKHSALRPERPASGSSSPCSSSTFGSSSELSPSRSHSRAASHTAGATAREPSPNSASASKRSLANNSTCLTASQRPTSQKTTARLSLNSVQVPPHQLNPNPKASIPRRRRLSEKEPSTGRPGQGGKARARPPPPQASARVPLGQRTAASAAKIRAYSAKQRPLGTAGRAQPHHQNPPVSTRGDKRPLPLSPVKVVPTVTAQHSPPSSALTRVASRGPSNRSSNATAIVPVRHRRRPNQQQLDSLIGAAYGGAAANPPVRQSQRKQQRQQQNPRHEQASSASSARLAASELLPHHASMPRRREPVIPAEVPRVPSPGKRPARDAGAGPTAAPKKPSVGSRPPTQVQTPVSVRHSTAHLLAPAVLTTPKDKPRLLREIESLSFVVPPPASLEVLTMADPSPSASPVRLEGRSGSIPVAFSDVSSEPNALADVSVITSASFTAYLKVDGWGPLTVDRQRPPRPVLADGSTNHSFVSADTPPDPAMTALCRAEPPTGHSPTPAAGGTPDSVPRTLFFRPRRGSSPKALSSLNGEGGAFSTSSPAPSPMRHNTLTPLAAESLQQQLRLSSGQGSPIKTTGSTGRLPAYTIFRLPTSTATRPAPTLVNHPHRLADSLRLSASVDGLAAVSPPANNTSQASQLSGTARASHRYPPLVAPLAYAMPGPDGCRDSGAASVGATPLLDVHAACRPSHPIQQRLSCDQMPLPERAAPAEVPSPPTVKRAGSNTGAALPTGTAHTLPFPGATSLQGGDWTEEEIDDGCGSAPITHAQLQDPDGADHVVVSGQRRGSNGRSKPPTPPAPVVDLMEDFDDECDAVNSPLGGLPRFLDNGDVTAHGAGPRTARDGDAADSGARMRDVPYPAYAHSRVSTAPSSLPTSVNPTGALTLKTVYKFQEMNGERKKKRGRLLLDN